jgi:hypothetical protein
METKVAECRKNTFEKCSKFGIISDRVVSGNDTMETRRAADGEEVGNVPFIVGCEEGVCGAEELRSIERHFDDCYMMVCCFWKDAIGFFFFKLIVTYDIGY